MERKCGTASVRIRLLHLLFLSPSLVWLGLGKDLTSFFFVSPFPECPTHSRQFVPCRGTIVVAKAAGEGIGQAMVGKMLGSSAREPKVN